MVFSDTGEVPAGSQTNSTAHAETPDRIRSTISDTHIGENQAAVSETAVETSHVNSEVALVNFNTSNSGIAMASDELLSSQSQLESLQKQLSDMKKLLDVTTAARQEVWIILCYLYCLNVHI